MKRRIPVIIVLILAATGFACNSTRTEINGLVSGGESERLSLERLDVNRTSLIDSIKIGKDGSFDIKFRLEEPELCILKSKEGEIINLLISPGDRISVESSYDQFGTTYTVTGSEESEGIHRLVGHLDQTRKELDSLEVLADSIGDPENPQMELVRNAYAQVIIKQKRFTIKYIVEHMGALSSVYALYQKYNGESLILNQEGDLQYFKAVADSLESTFPNSSLTRSLRTDIEQREASFIQTAHRDSILEMAGDEVSGMLDLSIADREGDLIRLSSLQGKVILVVFWASVSNESIQALLQLKQIYNKYHQKGFEVYAISLDTNRINWLSAIDFNEFNWINVLEYATPESRASQLYNITSLPTTFLINRDGDILARNLYGRTLETWLDNLI